MELPQSRRLFRSKSNRIIAGVCAGLARYFDIDPLLVRGLFILLSFADGFGIVVYVVLWIIVPEEGSLGEPGAGARVKNFIGEVGRNAEDLASGERRPSRDQWRNIVGFVIILVGLFALARQFFPFHWLNWDLVWPLLVIFLGVYFLSRKKG